jgi:hypothetical protein
VSGPECINDKEANAASMKRLTSPRSINCRRSTPRPAYQPRCSSIIDPTADAEVGTACLPACLPLSPQPSSVPSSPPRCPFLSHHPSFLLLLLLPIHRLVPAKTKTVDQKPCPTAQKGNSSLEPKTDRHVEPHHRLSTVRQPPVIASPCFLSAFARLLPSIPVGKCSHSAAFSTSACVSSRPASSVIRCP